MDKISNLIKPSGEETNLSNEDYIKLQSQWYNEEVGNLNEDDGISCPICKNKGNISYVENGHEFIKSCECMKSRNTYLRILKCGITKETLDRYSMQNWKTDDEWQKSLLQKCREFFMDLRDKKGHWFIVSGVSGSGKTHICTALFKELITTFKLNGYYILWNDEIPKLIALRKSVASENQANYDKRINELKNCDILYIDDLFKLDNRYKEDSLSILYEIINYRYMNNKIVLISSEFEREKFKNTDMAIYGRIFEKSYKGFFWITVSGEEKNYRLKSDVEYEQIL